MTIKPCPFCRSDEVEAEYLCAHYVACDSCGAMGPGCATEEAAIAMWNDVSEQVVYNPPEYVTFYVDVPDAQGTWDNVDSELTWEEAVALVEKFGGDDRGRVSLITAGGRVDAE